MNQGKSLSPTILNVVVGVLVRHWDSLEAERSGRDIRNDNTTQPTGRTIRASNNGRRRTDEGHMQMKVNAEFYMRAAGWWPPLTWGGSRPC